MKNNPKHRKSLVALIIVFILLLSFSVGTAIWVIINQDTAEVPGEYFPYDYDIEQTKNFTGKPLEIDNSLNGELGDENAITDIIYYKYNEHGKTEEEMLQEVEEAIYPGVYLVKVFANMTQTDGSIENVEITNVKFNIPKRPILVTIADSNLTYGDEDTSVTCSVSYGKVLDVEESGFIEEYDSKYFTEEEIKEINKLGINDENPIEYDHNYVKFANVGKYYLSASGFESDYYDIQFAGGVITVDPYELSYSWDDLTLVYNGADQAPTVKLEGILRNEDVCSANIIIKKSNDNKEYQAVMNQSSYSVYIDPNNPLTNTNYMITGYKDDTQTFKINPLELTFKWDYPTGGFIYSGLEQKLEATPTNAYEKDKITLTTEGGGTAANLQSDCKTLLAGKSSYKTKVVTINNNALGNYKLPTNGLETTFNIQPKTVSITWDLDEFTYSGSNQKPSASVVSSSLVANETEVVTVIVSDTGKINANYIDSETPIGTNNKYSIIADSVSSTNYKLPDKEEDKTGYYIIMQKLVSITWTTDAFDSDINYFAYTHVNSTTYFNPTATINESDLVAGEKNKPSLTYDGKEAEANATLAGVLQDDPNNEGQKKKAYVAKARLANEAGNYKLSTDEEVITREFIVKAAPVYPGWGEATDAIIPQALRKNMRTTITDTFTRVYNAASQLPVVVLKNAANEVVNSDLCSAIVHAQIEGEEAWILEAIDASVYTIVTATLSNSNYELADTITARLIIEPKEVYISWSNLIRSYNGAYQNATVSIQADVIGDDECYVYVDPLANRRDANAYYSSDLSLATERFGAIYNTWLAKNDNGEYTLFGADAHNYIFGAENTFENTFIIKQVPLSVYATKKEIIYGDNPTLEVADYLNAEGLMGQDTKFDLGIDDSEASISYDRYDDISLANDTYYATWKNAADNTNYHYTYYSANYIVNPKPVEVTWSTETNHIYDGKVWNPSVTIKGIVNNDSLYCVFDGSETDSNVKTGTEKYTATINKLASDTGKEINYYLTGDNYVMDFTISQREMTISWDKVSFVYDSTPRFPEYSLGNIVEKDLYTTDVIEDTSCYRTNVEYNIYAAFTETNDLNYILPNNYFTTYEITPIILGLSWTDLDLSYTGKPQIITPVISGVLTHETNLVDVYATDAKTNAGDYIATAYLSGNIYGNYALPNGITKAFTIKKVKLTATLNNNTIIYGDKPIHNNYVLSGFVNNENDSVVDTTKLDYDYSYEQYQDIGSNYTIIAKGLDAINYYFEYKNGTLTVNPKEVAISWSVDSRYIYNSDYQSPTAKVTNLVNNDTCDVTVSKFIKAGDHTSKVTALGNKNYTFTVPHTQDYTIEQKEVIIAWSVGTYTYNKTIQAPTYTPSGIISGDLCSIEVTGAGMNAGNHTLIAALKGNDKDNYIIKANSACGYTINPKTISVNWTVTSKEYNGEGQFPTYNLVGGISGDVLGEKLSESQTNAGTYTSSIASLTNTNYVLDDTKSTTFKITPVQLSIEWGKVSFDYNGTPQKPTAEITGLVAVDTGKVTVTVNGEQTNAGTYDATAVLGGDSGMNYILPTDGEKQAFTINKLWLTVTINNHSIIYGAQPSANGYTITGYLDGEGIDNINVINADYVHEYTQYGDIGDYDISMTGFAAINYDFRYNNAQLSVTPKEVQIAWTVEDYYEYDQQEHAPTARVTNLARAEDSCIVTVSKFINAGTHSSVVTELSNTNYYFTDETVGYSQEFTINPRGLDLSWSSLSEYIYNKNAQAPTIASVVGLLAGDECNVDVIGAGINAGNHTVTAELDGRSKDNYYVRTNPTYNYVISPKTVTIAWSNTTTIYNGVAQAPTYDIVGKCAGDEFDVVISDSVTNAGNYPFVIDALGNNNYLLDLNTNSTTFVIEKVKLTVTWTDTEFTYNGQFRKPTATLDNVLSCDIDEVNVNVSGEQKNANDSYEATATISGNKSGNYEFALNEDKTTFKINKKLLHVYANETSIYYGSLPDRCMVTYDGFADGEDSKVLSGELVYAYTYHRFDDITTEENSYFISVSGLISDNYEFEYHAGQLIVLPLDIQIRWENTEVTYNAEFQYPKATIINLARPEDVVEFGITEFKDAGTHQVRVGFVTNSNYTFGEEDTTEFIINHKEVSITWSNLSFNYDGTVKAPTVILNGVIVGDDCVAIIDGGTNEVGTHAVSVTGLSNANYVLIGDNLSTTFTITKLVIIIIIGNREVIYGDSLDGNGGFTYTYDESGFEDGDTFENSIFGEIYFKTDYIKGMDAGSTLSITAGGLSSDKYEISYQFGTLTVNRRTAYFTWGNTQLTYNGELQAPEVIFTNVIEGDTVNPIFDSKYRDYSEEYYEARLISIDNRNYEPLGDMAERFYINKAPLTITPLANEITYGDILSGKGVTYHGFMGTDDYTDLDGTLTYVSDTYDQSSPVGKYAFRASGLTARNYEITFEANELTVKPKDVTITWIATTLTYNGLAQNPNYTYEGIIDDDLEECQFKVVGAINAGTKHQATISIEGEKASNYKVVNEISPEFTIGKAPLRIIATANEITYGETPTNNGVTFEGFVNNEKADVLTGTLTFDYTYSQFGAISSVNNKYYIKPSGYSSTNYSITFVNGELTVNPYEVVISWSNLEFTYDGNPHVPTATVTNALNKDIVTVNVNGEEVNAGNTYVATAASLSNSNYKLAENAPTTAFVIKAKAITVSWTNTSLTYNGTIQKPIASITSESGVVGQDKVPLDVYADGKDVKDGTYEAIVSTSNTNYTIINESINYTIRKASLTVSWENTTVPYNGKGQFPTYEINGLLGDDTEDAYTVIPSGSYQTVKTHTASITLTSNNYQLTGKTETPFTITPAQLEIVWNSEGLIYDGTNQKPTATISGLVEGETGTVTVTVTVDGEHKNAGKYTATATLTGTAGDNYILPDTEQSIKYVIAQKVVKVTPNTSVITYGEAPIHNGVSYNGFIDGETIDNIEGKSGNIIYDYEYERYGDVLDQWFDITIDESDLVATNYKFEYVIGGLFVNRREVTITWQEPLEGEMIKLEYNGRPQAPNFTVSGILDIDKDICSVRVSGFTDVTPAYQVYTSEAFIDTTDSNKASNYEIVNATREFIIYPKRVHVDVKDATYNESTGFFELVYNGYDQKPNIYLDEEQVYEYDIVTLDTIGTGKDVKEGYYTTKVTSTNANYYVGNDEINFKIIKAKLSVEWSNTSVFYDGGPQFPTYTIEGLLGDDQAATAYKVTPIGTYINANYYQGVEKATLDIESTNYEFDDTASTEFEIKQAYLTLEWGVTNFTYDGTPKLPTAKIINGIVGDDEVSLEITGEQINARDQAYKATTEIVGYDASNYQLKLSTDMRKDFTISKAELIVKADDKNIIYGDNPDDLLFTVTYSGFKLDTENANNINLSGTIDYSYKYHQYGDVGKNYIITIDVSELESTNYTFKAETGILTVDPLKVSLSWIDTGLTYSGGPQKPTATINNLFAADKDLVYSITVEGEQTNASESAYTATAVAITGTSNYSIDLENCTTTFTIAPKPVTITWGETEFKYDGGVKVPVATVNPDDLCGTDGCTVTVTGAQTVAGSDYPATASSLSNSNYILSGDNLTTSFTILAIQLTVTVNSIEKVYGESFEFGVSYKLDGVAGTLPTDITGTIAYTVKLNGVATNSYLNVGEYTVEASGLNDTTGGYEISYVAGALAITPKDLTVTANKTTMTYGDEFTSQSVTYSGFAYNDDASSLGGTLTYTTIVTSSTGVGMYQYTPTGLTSSNYNITYVAGFVTIEAREVTVTWKEGPFTYTGKTINPITFGNVVNGDILTPSFVDSSGTSISIVKADTYSNLTLTGLGNDNYKLPLTGLTETIVVNKAPITLDTRFVDLEYDVDCRSWNDILSYLKLKTKFKDSNNEIMEDFVGFTISGMNNGVYYYGTSISGCSLPPTDTMYVIGSTYVVNVLLTNNNYEIVDDKFFVFKYKTVLVDGLYYTIEDALSPNISGTATLIGDNSGAKTYIATSFTKLTQNQLSRIDKEAETQNYYSNYSYILDNRTLVVPYKTGSSDAVYTGKVNHTAGEVYAALIIPSDVTISLTSGATLSAAAYIGYGTPSGANAMSATITCERGVILNNGSIYAASGSRVNSYGYIKGEGTLYLENGSETMDIIRTYDWPGGSAGSAMYKTVFPTNAFTMHNISCDTYIYAGAVYKISMHVIMAQDIPLIGYQVAAPLAEGIVVGNSSSENCMFQPLNDGGKDTYILKKAVKANIWDETHDSALALKSITGSNQIFGQKELLSIKGDYVDNKLKVNMNLLGMSVDFATSTDVAIPISYMDIELLQESTLVLSESDYMFMPGTSFKVGKGAVVSIGTGVDMAFLTRADLSNATYSNGSRDFNAYLVDANKDSYMEIKGTVNVNDGKVGGTIIAAANEAIFNLKGGTNTAAVKSLYSTEKPYYFEFTCIAKGNIPALNTTDSSSFTSNKAYVSQTIKNEDDTESYYWMEIPDSDLKEYIIQFYAEDGKTLKATRTIYTYKRSTYDVTGFEYRYSILHYDFINWFIMDIGVTDAEGNYTMSQTINTSIEDLENKKYAINEGVTIRLKAQFKETEYKIGYIFDYIYSDSTTGEIKRDRVDIEDVSGSLPEIFTLSDFVDDGNGNYVLTLPSGLSFNGEDTFNGWYIGTDASTNILVTSITLAQFEAYLSKSPTSVLSLYGEFSESFVTINITDSTHSINPAINTEIVIPSGSSLLEAGRSFAVSTNYDTDANSKQCFAGFKVNGDVSNTIYDKETIMNVKFCNNTNIDVVWETKDYTITYTFMYGNETIDSFEQYYNDKANVNIINNAQMRQREKLKYYFLDYWKENGAQIDYTSFVASGDRTFIASLSKFVKADISVNEWVTMSMTYTGYYINSDNALLYANNEKIFDQVTNLPDTTYYFLEGSTLSISYTINAGGESPTHSVNGLEEIADKKYKVNTSDCTISVTGTKESCVIEGTLITMADGTKKKVEDLNVGDLLLVFNHETGQYDVSPLLFLNHKDEGYKYYDVLTLLFSNGTELKIVQDHGLFHLESNKYIYINYSNYQEYIGHSFYSADFDGTNYTAKFITLVDAYITKEYTRVYCPVSAFHMNTFTNSLLSMPTIPYGIGGLVNIFEYDENMKYDEEAKQRDIEQYGLFTYDDFAEYMTYEAYMASPAVYLKVSMGKGYITYEEIILVIEYLLNGNLIE